MEIAEADATVYQCIREIATNVFPEASVPVNLFIPSSARLNELGGEPGGGLPEQWRGVECG
ncbi:MAG: hypothetical protein RML36_08920 [Anaerolineae bacterium]|nr:hypothetical protein [Anaerolineae bacterium]